ncbi:MAG: M48 family metallopeptidase [Acidimicrobiales bacterium]|jgi:predicted metal-dependent hydrolase
MAEYRSSSSPPASAATGVQLQLPTGPAGFRPQIEIRASARRRKTATAFYESGRIVVLVPARLTASERQELAGRLVDRLLQRTSRFVASDESLGSRAAHLSDRYLDGVRPRSIRWSATQNRRWGSCTPSTGDIRISGRLQVVPGWVLDSVIVHELAHLLEASHSPRFHELAKRYPRLCEADAYLLGYSLGMSSASWPLECELDDEAAC